MQRDWTVAVIVALIALIATPVGADPTSSPTSSSAPFPAYGTPAPKAATTTIVGVPQKVNLSQAVAIAAALSPVLTTARAAYHISEAGIAQARTPLNPAVEFQGAYGPQVGPNVSSTSNRSVVLSVTQLVYDGGRTISQIRAARSSTRGAAQTYRRALETLVYDVAQAYYNALLAESQSDLQQQIVQQDLVQEQLIAAQIRAGTVAPIDLKTAEIPTAQARVGVVRAQGSELASDAAFVVSLGLRADAAVLPLDDPASTEQSTLPADTTLDYNRAIARGLLLRPDYLAAIQQVESASSTLRAAHLGHWPVLGVGASEGNEFYGSGVPAQYFTQATASVSFPIYDQGVTNAAVQLATAQTEQAVAELQTNRLTVESDVRQSLVQLIAAQSAFALTADELTKTREVLAATQRQYRAGQTTLSLLLNAQTQLAQAETDRLTARYTLRTAEQNYLYALGENDLAERVQT